MSSQIDDTLFESIVAGVLDRLKGSPAPVTPTVAGSTKSTPAASRSGPVLLTERVVTEALLVEKLQGLRSVRFAPKAVLTPTARDFLRVNHIEWAYATKGSGEKKAAGGATAALIVRSTPLVTRVLNDLLPGIRTELLGCPDDAATLAIGEIVRGGFARALVFAEQTHRAACFANRSDTVKAVAVRDVADVAAIKKQLRANVWCLDPAGRSYFELRNLVKAVKD